MHKTFTLLLCLCFISFLTSCNITKKKECLNYENFEKFYYNNKTYCLPDNFNEIYSKCDFYGNRHQVGYTIGVYNKVFKFFTEYVIDQNYNSFLNDENNFLAFRIKYIYEDYIVTKYYDKIATYNDKVYIEKYNESNQRKIYVVNDKYALSLYDCILSMD